MFCLLTPWSGHRFSPVFLQEIMLTKMVYRSVQGPDDLPVRISRQDATLRWHRRTLPKARSTCFVTLLSSCCYPYHNGIKSHLTMIQNGHLQGTNFIISSKRANYRSYRLTKWVTRDPRAFRSLQNSPQHRGCGCSACSAKTKTSLT